MTAQSQRAALHEIAQALRRLRETDPQHRSELDAWDAQARAFTRWHHTQWPEVDLPSQVMFYLHDANIRLRDADYRAMQDEMIGEVIASLESGVVPAQLTRSLTVHPRWLGVLALIVLAVVWSCATR